MLKNIAILTAAVAAVGFLLVTVLRFNANFADVEMSGQGVTAMTLGIVITVVVGIGLVGFFFWSARRQSEAEDRERDFNAKTHP